ncbi:hypothetical protein [Halomonas sp. BC04]|uniref:hypothetical protein n=1 Tax=Halomonas sp. BC04 TaxID=1403540 RepID=UPI0003ED7CD1|nr:hypothetical protein [Halomonas sp. BC04]EWH00372.1 hypothetical protein Q427_19890 [Halomonas sp. BC04]
MMQAFFKAIEGQQPDPEWEAKLDGMSAKFRKLKLRANEEEATGGETQGAEVAQ